MQTEEQPDTLYAWCAGMFDGVGLVAVTPEEGPGGKHYHALTFEVIGIDEDKGDRFLRAAGNGEYDASIGVYTISGFAAVRGFVQALWPYLTRQSRARVNESIRHYKRYRLVDGGKISQ